MITSVKKQYAVSQIIFIGILKTMTSKSIVSYTSLNIFYICLRNGFLLLCTYVLLKKKNHNIYFFFFFLIPIRY